MTTPKVRRKFLLETQGRRQREEGRLNMASRLYWSMRRENDRETRDELLTKRNGQGQRLLGKMAELYGDLPGGREADLVPDPEGEV